MSRVSRLFVLAVSFFPLFAFGQFAEQNVNMVSGTQYPHGDPWLQRQNEPSVAVSTRNPLNLLALANDYRSVDIPFDTGAPLDSEERGDAWIGVFKSRNGGGTWWSDLLDGYPQQHNLASPLNGFQAGADPVVRSGPHGMFYGSGLVLNRGTNPLSAVFVARWIDNNNTENGDPFSYLGATVIDRGTSGAFDDKEWIAVGPGTGQCTVNGQTFAAQNVYIAYTTFVGGDNNIRTKLMFARSTDCGATWSAAQKLSEGYPINQGAQIVVSPSGPIYVVWRLFKSNTTLDAIMIAKSTDGGQTFTKAATVSTINPFEQGMTSSSIRTNAYPAAAADSTGRLYVVWSDKGTQFSANGDGRIVMMYSNDGVTWTGPFAIDNSAGRGHQFMPTIVSVGGKVTVAYYDLRDDSTIGVFTQTQTPHVGSYLENRKPVGDRGTLAGTDAGSTTYVFLPYLLDQGGHRRHTLDLRSTQVAVNAMGTTISAPVRVSRYVFGIRGPASSPSPCGPGCIEQLQFNPPNLPMFRQGTAPFIGDYIDITGYAPKTDGVYHVVWTDNRDVRPPKDGDWTHYTPVGPGHTSTFDNTTQTVCTAGQSGMRNQNIYTTRLTDGIYAGSPGNAKQLGTLPSGVPRQRAYAVFVENSTGAAKSFRLTITNQPVGGIATFQQFDPAVTPLPVPVTSIDVAVSGHSTATRTVYATSTDLHPLISVDVVEITVPGGSVVSGGLTTSVLLNPDVSNPDVSNPDVSNPDVSNPDVSNPDVSNPDVSNSDVHTPDVSNPDVSNPDVSNPDVSNPDVSNPDVSNPDVSNPDVSNPDVSNPDVSNPDVSNPDVSNASLGDATDTNWTVHNKGNTTSGYAVKLTSSTPLPGGVRTQLIVHRTYQTPTASTTSDGFSGCDFKVEKHNELISNVLDPVITTGGVITNPDAGDATLWLSPGDGARVTLRVYAPRTVFDPFTSVAPVVIAQAKNVVNGVISRSQSISTPLLITTTAIFDAVAGQPYSQQFAASGGQGTYTWTSTPAGIDQNGLFTHTFGTLDGPQTITVTVADTSNHTTSKVFPIRVGQPLTITTQSIPTAVVGQPYATTIQAIGGLGQYTWADYKTSIPPWLSLNQSTGVLSGTPPNAGSALMHIQVTDQSNLPGTQFALGDFVIRVAAPLSITTTSASSGIANQSYVDRLTSTGGLAPITWQVTSGSLPNGLQLGSDGTISGTPSATGLSSFTVTATDSSTTPLTAQATFSIDIEQQSANIVWFAPAQGANYNAGQSVTGQIEVRDNTGAVIPGVEIAASIGNNPTGVQVAPLVTTTNAAGQAAFVFNGLTVGNGYTLFVQASAFGLGSSVYSASPSFNVVNPPLVITTANLPAAYLTSADAGAGGTAPPVSTYNVRLTTAGGVPPVTWSITSGSLPASMIFDQFQGTISSSAMPVGFNAPGPSIFTVVATDSIGQTATQTYSLFVWAPQAAFCQSDFPLYNNTNVFGVNNGPTSADNVVTGLLSYQLRSMKTYHFNNGSGAPNGGTVWFIGDDNSELGPFTVSPQPQGNVPGANWVVTFATAPAIMNSGRTYTLNDSDAPTWSTNTQSKNEGFTVICVQPVSN